MKVFNLGPSGGYGGTNQTEEAGDLPFEIIKMVEIDLSYGDVVAGIRAEIQTSEGEKQMPWLGNPSGSASETIRLGNHEYLIGITGTYAALVNNIEFHTAIYENGVVTGTPSYGPFSGNGRNAPFEYFAPDGWQIVGFNGRSGNALDAIGVVLGKLPENP